ncbi:MAG: hypothetical protein RPS47_02645 [Colwellia sp.]
MQDGFIDMQQRYILKKIVYVNSATHGYSEFPIDKHMALFGDNNQGKTASLAGLKLALFPETSFTNCSKKFKFVGRDGDYTKEDSYNFYFPSYQSYIITEVENPNGDFCMVLYKARGEWEYGRYFVPGDYNSIKSLFWDRLAENEEGDFARNLKLDHIGPVLKASGGMQVNDSKKIASYLYSGFRGDPSQSRFCLCPLQDGASSTAIEAFRNLYQLAFDIGQTDKKTLPRAIATIIEMKRGRKEERLSTEIDQILAAYNELSARQAELTRLENSVPKWKDVKINYDQYIGIKKDLSIEFVKTVRLLNSEEITLEKSISSILKRLGNALQMEHQREKVFKGLNSELLNKKGRLDEAKKSEEGLTKKYTKALGVKNKYPSMDNVEILSIFSEERSKNERVIETLRSQESTANRLKQAILEKNKLASELGLLKEKLRSNQLGLLDLLPIESATTLYSINTAFADLPESLSMEAIEAVKEFSLFVTYQEEDVFFEGELLPKVKTNPYDLSDKRKCWQVRMEKTEGEIDGLNSEIEGLKSSLMDDDVRTKQMQAHKAEILSINRDADLIGALSELKNQTERVKENVNLYQADLEMLSDQISEADSLLNMAKHEAAVLKSERLNNEPRYKDVKNWKARLDKLDFDMPAIFDVVTESGDFDIAEATIMNIEGVSSTATTIRNQTVFDLASLISEALPDDDMAFQSFDTDTALDEKVTGLNIVFLELPQKVDLHEKSVQSHNRMIDNQLQELEEAQKTVEQFVNILNEGINKHKISNLDAIKLDLSLNSRYVQLMKDLKHYDRFGSSLLAPEFYKRLNKFCSEFFDGKKRTLNLEMLIEAIHYEYKEHGSTEFVKKSQSGGTTSTTTALVLSVLLNKISPEHVSVRIPIVVDEIGTLDGSNTITTIQTVAEHGFAVFCATPKPEPALMEGIRQWITIDKFQVKRPVIKNCHTLILPDLIERIGDLASA